MGLALNRVPTPRRLRVDLADRPLPGPCRSTARGQGYGAGTTRGRGQKCTRSIPKRQRRLEFETPEWLAYDLARRVRLALEIPEWLERGRARACRPVG